MKISSQEVFDEMKLIATQIWKTYDDTHGYVTEKLDRINNIDNVEDNAMVFYRMFDWNNQATFRKEASEEVLEYIKYNL